MHRLAVLSRQLVLPDEDRQLRRGRCAGSSPQGGEFEADRPPVIADRAQYEALYRRSIEDPAGFWADEAAEYHWAKKWDADHHSYNFDPAKGRVHIEWFKGGRTNITYNCLDRWVIAGHGNRVAFISEGNDLGHEKAVTYHQALSEVCRVANWLRGQGVRKGDAVLIYLPMIIELPIAMLACARIGAVHSVVFAGFSAESLAQRIQDCNAVAVVTASGVMRATKRVPLKALIDDALKLAAAAGHRSVRRVLVWEKSALPREETPWTPHRDAWWHDEIRSRPDFCAPEWLDAQDPLFMLYTSGSTGKPKGVLHAVGGWMVHVGAANKYCFDVRPGDVFWCTADCGWITGHSFLAYGPLLRGATAVVFGSTPAHPDPGRCWRVVEKYRVRQFFTAPTLIRALMQHGDEWVTKHDRSSLRVLGTAGEPINPHAWLWYRDVVGEGRCPIIDTWWQTETGAPMITPLPYAWPLKPGSATLPFFGVDLVLLDANGKEISGPGEGVLAIRRPWPAMMRTVHGDHARFESTYFSDFKGMYFTGDGCRRDEDGYYWITGRVDDVINVSGHRIGTAEVESALSSHAACAEAAVVSVPHDVKGESVRAFVVLVDGAPRAPATRKELLDLVRSQIGAFAAPDGLQFAPGLPKTRSGKIMRRVLKQIALGRYDQLGDLSGLAEPGVVDALVAGARAAARGGGQ